jgi:uncharacterized membrane protein YgdD (TMEM256/DUF423 family)
VDHYSDFFSVVFGAYCEHNLRESVSDEHFRSLMTAIRYNQINAVIISVIGIVVGMNGRLADIRTFKWSGYVFILGTLLFSFSIYLSVALEQPGLFYLTPVGGVTILLVWLVLASSGLAALKSK